MDHKNTWYRILIRIGRIGKSKVNRKELRGRPHELEVNTQNDLANADLIQCSQAIGAVHRKPSF